jgi:hypothetical protein
MRFVGWRWATPEIEEYDMQALRTATATRPEARTDEMDRAAFNAAFHELGLRWHWDGATWSTLSSSACEHERVRRYVEEEHPHLLRAYDADFLSQAVVRTKQRWRQALRDGVMPTGAPFDHADADSGF